MTTIVDISNEMITKEKFAIVLWTSNQIEYWVSFFSTSHDILFWTTLSSLSTNIDIPLEWIFLLTLLRHHVVEITDESVIYSSVFICYKLWWVLKLVFFFQFCSRFPAERVSFYFLQSKNLYKDRRKSGKIHFRGRIPSWLDSICCLSILCTKN